MNIIKKIFTSEIKAIDEKNMEITALVSTNAIDRYREVIDPAGMDAKNFKKNPVVLWAHDYSQPPIGKALWIKKEGDGIVSKMKFAATEKAKEIFNLYKDGFLKAFSIGFIPVATEDGDMERNPKGPRRIYKTWELLEYSAVPVPANPEALQLCVQRGIIAETDRAGIEERGFDVDDWNEEPVDNKKNGISGEDSATGALGRREIDDLLTEVETLARRVIELEDEGKQKDGEIRELGVTVLNQQQQIEKLKANPGITADQLGEKIVEVAGGVIRKHLGKV